MGARTFFSKRPRVLGYQAKGVPPEPTLLSILDFLFMKELLVTIT